MVIGDGMVMKFACTPVGRCTGSQPAGDRKSSTRRWRLPLLSARPAVTFPAAEHHRPVPTYTAWWQRHIGVNNLPKVVTRRCSEYDLNPRPIDRKSNTLYPFRYCATLHLGNRQNSSLQSRTRYCVSSSSTYFSASTITKAITTMHTV